MLKKLPKIIKLFFLIIFLLQIASLIFLLITPKISFAGITGSWAAESEYKQAIFTPNVKLPGSPTTIGQYVEAIYKYAIGIVGILATVVMMMGGVIWITAGGNTERISNAKSWISASLTGLVLALASYTILYTINPNLVKFKNNIAGNLKAIPNCCDQNNGPAPTIITYDEDHNPTYSCKSGLPECTNGQQCTKKEEETTWTCQ